MVLRPNLLAVLSANIWPEQECDFLSISTKVGITGEKEYRQALSNINAGLNVLKSELAATTAKFAENADSTEALKAKQDVLARTLLSQKEKVEAIREQLHKSAEAYGEGSQNTMKLQTALNKAEAEMYKTENALKKMDDAADNAGDSLEETAEDTKKASEKFKGFGDVVSDCASKIGIKLPSGITNGLNSLGSFNPAVLAAGAAVAALVTAIASAEKKLISWAKEAASTADEIVTLSVQTGLSTKTIQEFSYAAELVDVPLTTIQGSLTKLTAQMASAAAGNQKATDKFRELGVSIYDTNGNLRDAESVFYDAIDALGEIQNQTERDAAAMEIFGKSAQDLNPLIAQGSNVLRQYALEANQVGYVMDTMSLNKLTALDDSFQRMHNTVTAFKNELAQQFAPFLKDAVDSLSTFIGTLGQKFKEARIAEQLGMMLDSLVQLVPLVTQMAIDFIPMLVASLKPLATIVANLADGFSLLSGLLTMNWKKIATPLGLNSKYGVLSYSDTLKYATSGWVYDSKTQSWSGNGGYSSSSSSSDYYIKPGEEWRFHASGTPNFDGGWTWVGDKGPELLRLPQGSSILSAQDSRAASGGDIFNISINANSIREFEDIIRIVKQKKMLARMGV